MRDVTALFRMLDSLRDRSTLVETMSGETFCGLYQQVIWEGLASQRWNEEHLKTLDRQLASLDLLARCDTGLQGEQSALNDWLERTPRRQLADATTEILEFSWGFNGSREPALPLRVFILTCPRGWLRQNQLRVMQRFEGQLSLLDASRQRVYPEREPPLLAAIIAEEQDLSPYTCLARKIAPYCTKAVATTARVQTGLNMARLACALERHRLAHGEFPETLTELSPQFIDTLPHDLVNGLPLNYARMENDEFVLYSVGWNAPRDATKPDPAQPVSARWIWRYPAKEPAASGSRLMASRVETTR
jgi:hypothetical protein